MTCIQTPIPDDRGLYEAFYIKKGCVRKWMNESGLDEEGNNRGSSGINILWPNVNNEHYKYGNTRFRCNDI